MLLHYCPLCFAGYHDFALMRFHLLLEHMGNAAYPLSTLNNDVPISFELWNPINPSGLRWAFFYMPINGALFLLQFLSCPMSPCCVATPLFGDMDSVKVVFYSRGDAICVVVFSNSS